MNIGGPLYEQAVNEQLDTAARKARNKLSGDCPMLERALAPACQAVIAYLQRDSELHLYAYRSRN